MDYNDINSLLQEKSQAYGQTQAKFATLEPSLRESMFGNDSVTNNLNSMEKSKIDELFSHDQSVATQYQQNPQLSQTESGRILDPYARELALMNRYRGTAGDLTDIRQKKETRKDVIGESLANALKLAQASLEMKKTELEQLQRDRDFAFEVYKEQNSKKGGGSQGISSDFYNVILGLQQRLKESAPSASGVAKNSKELAAARKKYGQVNFTKNKDGTYSWNVPGTMVTPEEADPDVFKKLGAAAIAQGGSTSDISNILTFMGQDPTQTRGQTQDVAQAELADDLQRADKAINPQQFYLQIKQNYPEIPDPIVKSMMTAAGFTIY